MSTNARGNFPVLDLTFKNYGVTDIEANLGVLADTSNPGSVTAAPGIVLPTASGGVVGTLGITVEKIPAGATGRVRVNGVSTGTAHGSVTYGTGVQISDTTAHLGQIKTCGAATTQVGIALNTAADGELVSVLHSVAKNA